VSYAVFVGLGFLVAFGVKRLEESRLGYRARPGYRFVAVGALVGAVVGAKVGMLLYVPFDAWRDILRDLAAFHFEGKTVLGGLAGGFAGVEVAKRLAGVTGSTGDAYALAIPLGQAVGRLGCFFAGCCYGSPSTLPWAIASHGELRHPVQLYDAACCLLLALGVAALRGRDWPPGRLFRVMLIGYGLLRILLDPLRGDERMTFGPFSLAQWFCAAAMAALALSIWRPGAKESLA